tara:strand:- start:94 stop:357 length:264 start_codon:yes stop_codon:yes gene_type:complete
MLLASKLIIYTHTKENEMSDSKNGYQLRTELLGMAIGIVSDRTSRLEANEHFLADNDKRYQRKPILPFTSDDVISEAEKLYAFVQKK